MPECKYEDCWCKAENLSDDQQQAHDDHNYWKEFCPSGWLVSGFTYRQSASFVKIDERNILVSSVQVDQQVKSFIDAIVEDMS